MLRVGELTAADVQEWRRLCESVPQLISPFYAYAYALAVAETGREVRICRLQREGAPVGFLPFQFAGAIERTLGAGEPLGGSMTDYVGIIARPDVQIAPAGLLRACRLNYFAFTHLDRPQLEYGLQAETSEPGLRIVMGADARSYWDTLRTTDGKFVGDTERRERQLATQVGELQLTFETTDAAVLEHLIAEKRRQYRDTHVPDALAEPWKIQLLNNLMKQQDPGCQPILSTLRAGSTWVASHLGLRHGPVLHYWFPVYNPELRRYSPGRLLLKTILRAASERGVQVIDRGAGASEAKRDLANESHDYFSGVWHRNGPRAFSFRAIQSARWRRQARLAKPSA